MIEADVGFSSDFIGMQAQKRNSKSSKEKGSACHTMLKSPSLTNRNCLNRNPREPIQRPLPS